MNKNRWLLFLILYMAAFCIACSQLKVIMIFSEISGAMGILPQQTSWLMSVFTIAGIVLSAPGAAILDKLGAKNLLLCLLAASIAGNLLGGLASSYSLLLISRMIEGIAFAMITMVGVVLISYWFAGAKAGLAIGIFTTYPATGYVCCMNLSAPLAAALGYKSLWFIVAMMAIFCFALVLFGIKAPPIATDTVKAPAKKQILLGEAVANKKVWLLAVGQGCVAFILFTFITLYPQLFMEVYHLEQAKAGFYAGLNGLFGLVFCILAGLLIDKFKNAPLIALVSFIGLAITCFISTGLSEATYVLHTLLTAMFCGLIIPSVLYLAPLSAKRPALVGYTVALINQLYFIGIFAGAPLIMNAIARKGWQAGCNIMAAIALLGALAVAVFDRERRGDGG